MSLTASFSLVYGLAAAIALAAAAVVWPRRTALWALCDAIELHVATVEGKLLVAQIQYIGIVAAPRWSSPMASAPSAR